MGLIDSAIDSAVDAFRFKDTIFYKENSDLQDKYDALKKLNKEIKNINTKKHNLLISILLFNKNIFFVLMKCYLRLSR